MLYSGVQGELGYDYLVSVSCCVIGTKTLHPYSSFSKRWSFYTRSVQFTTCYLQLLSCFCAVLGFILSAVRMYWCSFCFIFSLVKLLKVQCSSQIGKYQFPPKCQSLSSRERTKKSYCTHYQSRGLLTIMDGFLIHTRAKKKCI